MSGKFRRQVGGGGEGGWHPSEQGAERCYFILELELQSKDSASV